MAACRECNRRFVRNRRFGVGGSWDEGRGGLALLRRLAPRHAKQGFSVVALLYPKGITWQIVFPGDLSHFELETPIVAFRTRFLEERRHRHCNTVAAGAARVLARDTIEPTFPAAREGDGRRKRGRT